MTDNILVYLKIKPEELDSGITIEGQNIRVVSQSSFEEKTFQFKAILQENQDLQQHCIPIIEQAIKRQENACLIAYGQSKSGKSHTLGFSLYHEGLLHSLLQYVFEHMQIPQLTISMIQLHLQQALDLMNQDLPELKIRSRLNEIYIENLTEMIASNYQESLYICEEAIQKLQLSKLHTILTLRILKSKISFVEIAGAHAKSTEQANVTALFKVLSSLHKQQLSGLQQFIPFRDSRLTMLLKNQLQAPSKVLLIGTIFPKNTNDTMKTIQALQSCTKIFNNPPRSVTPNKPKPVAEINYKELSEYLLKLLTKINCHACKLVNQEGIPLIDVNQSLEKIIQQIQTVSHQLISIINSKATTVNVQQKSDGWQKAIKYLYNTYEEEIQREDKLIKEKLLYIINEDEQYDIENLRKTLFPPKQDYVNNIYKTLSSLRKYTNSIQIPINRENYRTKLTTSLLEKENEFTNFSSHEQTSKQEQITFQSYTSSLMNKFKGIRSYQPDQQYQS